MVSLMHVKQPVERIYTPDQLVFKKKLLKK
jgi:hypothetical protein